MTSDLNVSGTEMEMDDLFENAQTISVRTFKHIGNNNWEITLRHSDEQPLKSNIKRARTIKSLREIDRKRTF